MHKMFLMLDKSQCWKSEVRGHIQSLGLNKLVWMQNISIKQEKESHGSHDNLQIISSITVSLHILQQYSLITTKQFPCIV
jgi:hypothetical protein